MDGRAEPLQPQPTDDAAATDGLDRRAILLAGGAALAGAAAAALAGAERADAGHNTDIAYDTQTVMHVDVTNTTAGSTRVSTNISGTAAFVGLNNYPVGISRPDGILGRTAYTTSNAAGVAGHERVGGRRHRRDGRRQGDGRDGRLRRRRNRRSVGGPAGRHGRASAGARPTASSGMSSAPASAWRARLANAAGVKGQSTSANGVHGASASGTGVRGETTTGGVGVLGVAGSGGVAGRFVGPAVVEGSLAANAVDVLSAAKVGSTLDVAGAAKVGTTLEVAGQATLGALTARGDVEAAGAVHLASTLDVTGRATVAALQVAGAAHFAGPVTLGQEQEIGKLRLPKTSGVVTLKRAAASVSVPNVELAAGTLVLATIQTLRKGLVVAAAVPSPKGKKITIHFNKRAPKGTKVAWMLVN